MNDAAIDGKMTNVSVSPWLSWLRAALARPLPGLPGQMGMSPRPRPGAERILDPDLDCRRAGVLALLYPGDAGAAPYIVLTRRTNSVESHRGQISFPGGSMEPGEDAVAAALREAQEELGVDPAALTVVGRLSPLYIPPSDFCIYPAVAYAAARPAFVPSPHEVAEVLEVPLAHLLSPATRCEEVWEIRGAAVHVPYYAFGQHKIWGATAMVLCELLALLSGAGGSDLSS
ncbi:MAG: putative NUDIX hydrolase [Chloroflexi bacterium ADurb.Bin325]|nr:MAG: putative NUDIX hydrolase [Chloroflexi bacterium ADurb.Bin325]